MEVVGELALGGQALSSRDLGAVPSKSPPPQVGGEREVAKGAKAMARASTRSVTSSACA